MYHVAFPQKSNRASWVFTGLVTDLNNNPIDLTGFSLVFQVSPKRGAATFGYGHGTYDDTNAVGSLTASTANGKLTIIGLGTFRVFFTLTDMRSLCPGTYQTGLTVTNNDGSQTEQLSVGPLPIIDGVVP